VVNQIKANKQVKAGWFYFNNDVTAAAIDNAKEMIGMVG
jgi:uncharacterized protein YecE (DUF72 family)